MVLDGKVDEERTKCVKVGGYHVSQCLKQALSWKEAKEAAGATVSSLDTSSVKQKCRLSMNINREGDHRHPTRTETVHIKSQLDPEKSSKLEMIEVSAVFQPIKLQLS